MPTTPAIQRGATARMFESDFFEFFSKVHPAVPGLLFAPVAAWFLWQGAQTAPVLDAALAVAFGVAAWTLLEYSLHRFLFHVPPEGPVRRWINWTFHGVHHQFPDDPRRLVMVPSVSVPLALLFHATIFALAPAALAPSVFAGIVLGYLWYDYSHWATHYWKPPQHPLLRPLARAMRAQRARHMRHHFGDPEADYGVSVGLWDFVFDTGAGERSAPAWFDRLTRGLVRDERDTFVAWTVASLAVRAITPAVLLFAFDAPWWVCAASMAFTLTSSTDRYTLMLHVVSHRPLFRKQIGWLNHFVPAILGPFYGQTPFSYYVHHVGMHHAEGNLEDDLSTTMPFDGDRLSHWLRYAGRFFFLAPVDLGRYLLRKKQHKLLSLMLKGELTWLLVVASLALWRPVPTLFVFVLPVVILRVAMMQGNWAQHAFVDLSDPANPYRNSVDLVASPHNRRCFNDGYHIVHHRRPLMHWTEMAAEHASHRDDYAANDAMVFRDVPNFIVLWKWLMAKDYDRMAEHFVDYRGGRSKEQIIEVIRSRVRRAS